MFDVGFWEIGLIGVVMLIVVGPERLPKVARTLGLWVGKARRVVSEVKAEVDRELRLDELKRDFQDQARAGELKSLTDQVRDLEADLRSVNPARPDFDRPATPPVPAKPPAPTAESSPAEGESKSSTK